MEKIRIIAEKLSNIPWQDKPVGLAGPVWRSSDNPIIQRNPVKGVARTFNSAVAPLADKFVGVFRAETINGRPHLHLGWSDDGINWEIEEERIAFVDENNQPYQPRYAYDPRLIKIENTFYIIWCTDFFGASIGLAKTDDFKRFVRVENPFLPFNRNGVLFPRKINDKFIMLSRPSDQGHTPFGDIFISESPDLSYWGNHKQVMSKGGQGWWQSLKIGGGPAPIETTVGWLMFYHGVTQTCNGYVYSMGGVILDQEQPSRVKHRSANYLLTPEEWYEERGFVGNVIFPCATLQDAGTGKIAIYYGAADTYVGIAFTTVEEVVTYIIETDEEVGEDQLLGRI